MFKIDYKPLLQGNDIPAKRMAWNNFTDSLCKSRMISEKQYMTWDQPQFINSPKKSPK